MLFALRHKVLKINNDGLKQGMNMLDKEENHKIVSRDMYDDSR